MGTRSVGAFTRMCTIAAQALTGQVPLHNALPAQVNWLRSSAMENDIAMALHKRAAMYIYRVSAQIAASKAWDVHC